MEDQETADFCNVTLRREDGVKSFSAAAKSADVSVSVVVSLREVEEGGI